MTTYLQQIFTYFRNLTLNSTGVSRDLYALIRDKDIDKALGMLDERDDEVDQAIREYNPQTHDVMKRPNKYRRKEEPYITEKLPRTRQRYINEVELFFLLGKPIVWKKTAGDDKVFEQFSNLLDELHFNSRIRQAKRLAGAETESAILVDMYRDGRSHEPIVKMTVLARSTGYRLRPLFDNHGNMTAFAYGCKVKESGRIVQRWDFQTPDIIARAKKAAVGWDVELYPNPTGKINVIYFRQPKAWDGAEMRIAREEMLDSKTGDTNNYFSDPIATATADVIDSMADPNKPGKLIQLNGDKSHFGYVNPPQSSQTRDSEKADLQKSILFDTFTPDFDPDHMRGLGTLSGVAIKNAMILGYVKRDNRIEVYGELIARLRNILLAVVKWRNPGLDVDGTRIKFEFAEPFADDRRNQWTAIAQLYGAGLLSLETAVAMLALCNAPMEEVERIRSAAGKKSE